MGAGLFAGAVDGFGERAVKNVVDEGALAAAADAGDDGHDAEGNTDGEVLQVVFAGAGDGEPLAGERARLGAMQHGGGAGEIAAGERSGRRHDLLRCSFGDDDAAETAGAGAEIENVVGVADGVFVVLDDEDGVAEIAKAFERLDEARCCRAGGGRWRARRARRGRRGGVSRSGWRDGCAGLRRRREWRRCGRGKDR